MSHESIKTAEERLCGINYRETEFIQALSCEVEELRAQNEALKQENAKQAKRIAELDGCLIGWLDKTEFVQKDEHKLFSGCAGLHRADAMRLIIDKLREQVEELSHRAPTTVGLGQAQRRIDV